MENLEASQLQPPSHSADRPSSPGFMQKLKRTSHWFLMFIELPLRFLFGRDLFISYSRSDSRKYAPNLALVLQKRMPKLSFYLDRWIAPPSGKLPLSLRLQLRWSSIMVVVCTPNAIGSTFVKDEVSRFATLGRKVLTVDVDGAFNAVRGQEPWVGFSGADPEEESVDAIRSGIPSDNVVERILKMVEFTTQDRRLRRAVWGTLAFVLLSVGGIGAYGYSANKKAEVAEARATAANKQAVEADKKAEEAGLRALAAQKQEAAAKQAQLTAEKRETEANTRAKEAEGLRDDAERKAGEALEKERVATIEAQKQQKIALARRLAAENNLAADPQSTEFEKKILLTVESMRLFPSREAYSNLVEGIKITPHPLKKSATHPDEVSKVTFSPDGKYMATLSGGALWLHRVDATDGEIAEARRISREGERITNVAFSPDGAYLAAEYKGGVRLWRANEIRELASIAGSHVVLFGGASNLIAVLDNEAADARGDVRSNVVRVWRPEGEGAREVANVAVVGKVSDITFTTDSPFFTILVNEGDENARLDFWHQTGGPQTQPVAGPIRVAAGTGFSPNAKYQWVEGDTANGVTKTLLKANMREPVLDNLRSIDFSPDGRFLVTTRFDPEYGELRETIVWDASGDSLKKLHSLDARLRGVWFSPDGSRFAQIIEKNRVKVWNTLTGQVVAYVKFKGEYTDLAFTHDGRFMAVATGKDVKVWPTGREWKASEFVHPWGLRLTAFSPDGTLVALAEKTEVTILQAANGNKVSKFSTPCEINHLSFGVSNERVVSRGRCGSWLWHTRDGGRLGPVGVLPESFYAVSRDLKYAALGDGVGLMVVELANRSNVVRLGDDAAARSTDDDESANDPSRITVAFSGDGNRLAIASRNRIEVWEWRTRRLLHVIEQRIRGSEDYNSTVKVAFDEDDNDTVITADMYEAVVWNLRDSPRVVGRVELQEPRNNTNFYTTLSPNGKFVATTLQVFKTKDLAAHNRTTVWQLRPTDVGRNACSRLESDRLPEPEWKREFGSERYRATCADLKLPARE